LVLRELRREEDPKAHATLLQAVVESQTRSTDLVDELTKELRANPWVESVDVTGTDPEAE